MNNEFSIAIIPDTQILAKSHPEHFTRMTQWIASHAQELNLKMALHLGDVVNNGESDIGQYERSQEALNVIDEAGIPMLIVPGNHDYDNMLGTDRSLSLFNRYFGTHRYENKSWFGGTYEDGQAENCYATLDIGGEKYLFLALEFGPRDKVLAWADRVLEEHRDHRAIIITHCYMYMDGTRNKPGDKHNPKIYEGAVGANDGEDMWQKSFKRHPNVIGVYSGHQIMKNVSYRVDWGDQGNMVFQSFQNWQAAPEGGQGRFRLLRFRPAEGVILLQVFNPKTGELETRDGYELSISYQTPAEPFELAFSEESWLKADKA
jgi:predicted phosphodiesterase